MTRFAYPPHQHMQNGAETQTHTHGSNKNFNYSIKLHSKALLQSSEFRVWRNAKWLTAHKIDTAAIARTGVWKVGSGGVRGPYEVLSGPRTMHSHGEII